MFTALLVSQVLLWLVVVVLAIVVLAMVRHIGVLQARIAPVGALVPQELPKVGEPGPMFLLPDFEGRPVQIGGTREDGQATLVIWVGPSCPVCKALVPVLKAIRRSESSWLSIVIASDGDPSEHRAMRRLVDDLFPYVLSSELGVAYQVPKVPYAVLLDGSGIVRAKGIVNTREHIESLFEAYRQGVGSVQEYLQRQRVTG